ncbi:hypothetical protein [Pseudoalteromonas sp. T1lg48]|uniref:hypothetical protein n=1 Tax=Pseudoalteromonas sp. T1lg48 TaxID=2077100 RepID=UPI001319D852|nr:hypothetical protein [Pseudoalteromonas sp. T1lg48]
MDQSQISGKQQHLNSRHGAAPVIPQIPTKGEGDRANYKGNNAGRDGEGKSFNLGHGAG